MAYINGKKITLGTLVHAEGSGGGTYVEANPEDAATETLEKLKVDDTTYSVDGFSGDYNDLSNKPTIPTKTSDLTNDSGFLTQHQDISGKEDKSNKVTSFQATPDNTHYASEKLVKDSLDTKVDKATGKGLSKNDFTDNYKNKLDGIEAGAKVNVQSDWSQTDTNADDYIKNKPYIPAGVIVDQNYDATSTNAQSGTAVAEAISGKANTSDLSSVATSGSYNDLSNKPTIPDELSDLQDDSTHRLVTDTEKATWNNIESIENSLNVITLTGNSGTLTQDQYNSLGNRTLIIKNNLAFYYHYLSNGEYVYICDETIDDTESHTFKIIISSNRSWQFEDIEKNIPVNVQSDWNEADTTADDYIKNKPTIPSALSDLSDDTTHRVVTDTEKATWNGKSNFSGSYNDLTNKPTIPDEVIANPTLAGIEADLTGLQVGATKYKIPSGGGSTLNVITLTGNSGTLTQDQYNSLGIRTLIIRNNLAYYYHYLSNGEYVYICDETIDDTESHTFKIIISSNRSWQFEDIEKNIPDVSSKYEHNIHIIYANGEVSLFLKITSDSATTMTYSDVYEWLVNKGFSDQSGTLMEYQATGVQMKSSPVTIHGTIISVGANYNNANKVIFIHYTGIDFTNNDVVSNTTFINNLNINRCDDTVI